MLQSKDKTTNIGAIIILFNPDIKIILENLNELSAQVDEVCLVDNTPQTDNSKYFEQVANMHYIGLQENVGIAKAQNIGINYFLDKPNIKYLLFLDQDSKISKNLAISLRDDYVNLSKQFCVIAIGPQAISSDTKKTYVSNSSIIKKIFVDNKEYWKMRNIPSSYSLTEKETFIKYGFFNERLFIDCVEHEWFWRVKEKSHGDLYIDPALKFSHQMGTPIKFFGYKTSISTPFRLYYQVRNVLWVAKLGYSPKSWKKKQLTRLVIKSFWYPIFISPRLKYLKSIARGIKDGLFQHC